MPNFNYFNQNTQQWEIISTDVTPEVQNELDKIEKLDKKSVVSVVDYGAKGDETDPTGTTLAIKEALDFAKELGKPVYFPSGRYAITETLIIPSGIRLIGDNTKDAWEGVSKGSVVVTSGNGNPARWTDIDGNDGNIAPAIVFGGNEVSMENITVECGNTRWDAAIFLPCVKRSTLINVDTVGQWKKAGLYIDATWSNENTTLTGLHTDVKSSTGANELYAENCYFRGFWGVLIQGTTRNPTTTPWVWGRGGTSDLSFVACRLGSDNSDATIEERKLDGGAYKSDVQLSGTGVVGQGHNFVNCSFRTGSKYMIYLNRSNRDTFVNCYGETLSDWNNGSAVFAITSNTGEVCRVNDKINANIMRDGVMVTSSASTAPYYSTKMSVLRTDGRLYTPNFSGYGANPSNPTEIISYYKPNSWGATNSYAVDDVILSNGNFYVCTVAGISGSTPPSHTSGTAVDGTVTWLYTTTVEGRIVFKNGEDNAKFAEISKGKFDLRAIPRLQFESTLDFYRKYSEDVKFSITNSANISYQILRGSVDNAISLGTNGTRWSQLYAGTGTINTSDEREKQQISQIPDAVLDAWSEVNYVRYKFNDAVEEKGSAARWHTGLIAQEIQEVFESHGLDAFSYGILCYDEWQEKRDDEGNIVVQAGNRYGIRPDECQFLEMALMRRELNRLKTPQ